MSEANDATRAMGPDAKPVATGRVRRHFPADALDLLSVAALGFLLSWCAARSKTMTSQFLQDYVREYAWLALWCFVALFLVQAVVLCLSSFGFVSRALRDRLALGGALLVSAVVVAVAGPWTELPGMHVTPHWGWQGCEDLVGATRPPSAQLLTLCLGDRATGRQKVAREAHPEVRRDGTSASRRGHTPAARKIPRAVTGSTGRTIREWLRNVLWTTACALGAAMVLTTGAAARAAPAWIGPSSHATAQLREPIALADGSVVTLDAYSEVKVRMRSVSKAAGTQSRTDAGPYQPGMVAAFQCAGGEAAQRRDRGRLISRIPRESDQRGHDGSLGERLTKREHSPVGFHTAYRRNVDPCEGGAWGTRQNHGRHGHAVSPDGGRGARARPRVATPAEVSFPSDSAQRGGR